MLNITVLYHHQYLTYCNNEFNKSYAIIQNKNKTNGSIISGDLCKLNDLSMDYKKIDFDLLVGCDGFSSQVRKSAGIGTTVENS